MKCSSICTTLAAIGFIAVTTLVVGCDGDDQDAHLGTWEHRDSLLGRHMFVTLHENNTGTMVTKINFRDSGTARTIRWARLGDMVLLFHLVDGNRTGVPFKYLKIQDGELCWIDPKNPDFEPVVLKPGKALTSLAYVRTD